MTETFFIFGYGSLIFSPELPDAVIDMKPARLLGYRRSFNKRSTLRGCNSDECYNAFPDIADGFSRNGFTHSLVLGTEVDSDAEIVGMTVEYPGDAWEELFRRLDVREYYNASAPVAQNGYLRTDVTVVPADGLQPHHAVTYLSNPSPDCVWRAPTELTLKQRAKLLINATPMAPDSATAWREARGLFYLEGVRKNLRKINIIDNNLERLAGAVLTIEGPWQSLIFPPDGL